MDRFFSAIPVFGFFVMTLLLVLGGAECGYRWAKKRQARRDQEKEAPINAMVGATLGLLAFLLAFTFGIATGAFHARKVALVQEVNATRMTYLLCDVIPAAHRAEIRTTLREYVDQRLRWANGEPG